MSIPRSVVKFSKNGVEYTSSVDRASYTIQELTRAALRDVGKFVSRICNREASKLPGLKRNRRTYGKLHGKSPAFQFFVLKREGNLVVGTKSSTWYGEQQELGTMKQPKRGILRSAVYNNIQKIVEIESKYLSALEDEAAALALIESEEDYQGGGEDD